MKRTKPSSGNFALGYGKPPSNHQFRKGQSGNPGGRPRGMTLGRANALALKEAYRKICVRVGDKTVRMPAIQAVLRSQLALAVKGNLTAQRFFIDTIRAIEHLATPIPIAPNLDLPTEGKFTGRHLAKALLFALHEDEPS